MDRLAHVSPPRVPSGTRLFLPYMIVDLSILLAGAGLSITGSITGSVPAWVGWAIVACLLVPWLAWQGRVFIRWGMLDQQQIDLESAVGHWSLARGDVRVTGRLVPDDPDDARLFAYKITVSLSEDTGHATVTALRPDD